MENIKSFEKLIEAKKIAIPQIQRDYVQGSDKHSEKREKFINTLIEHLHEKSNLHIDFIYGSCDENNKSIFYPLDGQQRLTTLYLLHWILEVLIGRRNGAVEDRQYTDVLTYQSRRSSDLFCHKLSTDKFDDTFKGTVSEYIKNEKKWYVSEWNLDPTIRAILEMLDVMQKKLSGYTKEQLTDMLNNFEVISFDYCDLDDYHLTDSLYIKMNERGKQLTEFENWKALFINFLEKEDKKHIERVRDTGKREKFSDVFKDSIEHKWTDMLWPYAFEKWQEELEKLSEEEKSQKSYPAVDDYFMNLLAFIHETLFFASNPKVDGRDVQTGDFQDTLTSMERVFADESNLTFLFDFLDVWCNVKDINSFFNDLFGEEGLALWWEGNECDNLFKVCINNGLDMRDRFKILFYAISKYCISIKCNSVTDELKLFVRICRNLIESVYQFNRDKVVCSTNIRLPEWSRYKRAIDGIVSNIVSDKPWFENVGAFGDIEHEKEKYGDNGKGNPFFERWEDKKIFKGCLKAVLPALRDGNSLYDVDKAITAFINASEVEKIQLLVAFGYDGYYSERLGYCDDYTRQKCFFGKDEKWDVIFRRSFEKEDEKKESEKRVETAFSKFVFGYKECPNVNDLIARELRHSEWNTFKYYMLKYPKFVQGNVNTHYFAVKAEYDDLDMININISSNPLRGYHCDSFAYVVCLNIDPAIRRLKCWSEGKNNRSSVYLQYSPNDRGECFAELHSCKDGWIMRKKDEKNREYLKSLYAELGEKGVEMEDYGEGEKLIRVAEGKGDLIEMGEKVARTCLDWINKNFEAKLE